jgi:hypothetical protein
MCDRCGSNGSFIAICWGEWKDPQSKEMKFLCKECDNEWRKVWNEKFHNKDTIPLTFRNELIELFFKFLGNKTPEKVEFT